MTIGIKKLKNLIAKRWKDDKEEFKYLIGNSILLTLAIWFVVFAISTDSELDRLTLLFVSFVCISWINERRVDRKIEVLEKGVYVSLMRTDQAMEKVSDFTKVVKSSK